MQLDLSTDYTVWDNVQEIVYLSSRTSGPVTQTVATAKVRAIQNRELAASGGVYVAGDIVVIIPAVLLTGGTVPKPGDQVLTLAGQVLTVLSEQGGKRDRSALPQTWRLVTRNLSLAFDLRDTISIQRAFIEYDATGAVLRAWPDNNQPGIHARGSTPYQSIAARVQMEAKEDAEEHGVAGLRERFSVILDRQVLLTREDRVKVEAWRQGGTPIYLDIESLTNPERIDELPKLECVRAL